MPNTAQRAPTPADTKTVQFLKNVIAWPDANGPGYINLHTNSKNGDPSKNGGQPWMIGWPFKDINKFIERATWIDKSEIMFNVWFCTSQQGTAQTNPKTGKVRALRRAVNATAQKSVWIDCDVKPRPETWDAENPGKRWDHYETVVEAMKAISRFCRKVDLPKPSAVVNSGGGLHVYWISDKPLPPSEWQPYACGLKALMLQEGRRRRKQQLGCRARYGTPRKGGCCSQHGGHDRAPCSQGP
jgi:hypothetical protein